MFKQTSISKKENQNAASIIEQLGAITTEQQSKFAELTGRFDGQFKIGKPANNIIGKSIE